MESLGEDMTESVESNDIVQASSGVELFFHPNLRRCPWDHMMGTTG